MKCVHEEDVDVGGWMDGWMAVDDKWWMDVHQDGRP